MPVVITTTTVATPSVGARLNFGKLKSLVRQNIGNRMDKEELIGLALNLAQVQVSLLHSWRSLQTVTTLSIPAGTSQVAISGSEPYNVRFEYNEYTRLVPVTRKDVFDANFGDPSVEDASLPVACYFHNNVLYLSTPTSVDGILRVTMLTPPTELVNDTDVSILDVDLVLVNWATSYVLRSLGTPELSQVWDKQFEIAFKTATIAHDRGVAVERNTGGNDMLRLTSGRPWLDPFVGG